MSDEYIIHGPPSKTPVSKVSLGIQAFEALQKQEPSVIFIDGFTKKSVTNKELLDFTIKLARSMQNYGLKQNDVIGIVSENNVMYFHPILASLYLGVIVTMFNPKYTLDEFIHVSNISKPKILFCSMYTKEMVLKMANQMKIFSKIVVIDADSTDCNSLTTFISQNLENSFKIDQFKPIIVNTDEQVAFVLYSSGTTGKPKGVMITHTNLNCLFVLSKHRKNKTNKIAMLAILPLYHGFGFFTIFLKILANQKVIVLKKFDPEVFLKTIQDFKIKYVHIVPAIAHFLATSPLVEKYDLSCLDKILCGGAPLSETVQVSLKKRFNSEQVRQAYGLTETTSSIICPQDSATPLGSNGKIRPYSSIKVVDPTTGKTLGPMQRGELHCGGLLIMKGYMNDIANTNAVIDKNGWFRTGDIGYYDQNGYFYIVDRLKDLIKYKGYQVAPAELEDVLLKHPEILDAAVIGISDEKAGELPFAFIVRKNNITKSDVQEHVSGQLSPEKHLRGGVEFVDHIPRSANGKILKLVLRDRLKNKKSKL